LKMRPETNRASLLLRYRRNRNGARFATWFLVGRERGSLFTLALPRSWTVTDPPIITVTGKAYFDVGHAPKDQSNRRKYLPDYAAWEIHPVMKIEFSNQAERHLSIHCS